MTCIFHAGMDVVCIDDQVPLAGGGFVKDANITKGVVYRIRWLGMAHLYPVGDYLGVKLEGIDSGFGEPLGCAGCTVCRAAVSPAGARSYRAVSTDCGRPAWLQGDGTGRAGARRAG